MATFAAGIELVPTVGGVTSTADPNFRQCTVEIENATKYYSLENPSVYMKTGYCNKALPFEVNPEATHHANFTTTVNKEDTAAGVFTYDLSSTGSCTTNKVAVMFTVPYDYNAHANWSAVGVYSSNTKCDEALYEEMFNNEPQCGFVRGKAADCFLKYEDGGVVIDASMTNSFTPYLKVRVQQKKIKNA